MLVPRAAVAPYVTPLCATVLTVQPTVMEELEVEVTGLLITRGALMLMVLDAD